MQKLKYVFHIKTNANDKDNTTRNEHSETTPPGTHATDTKTPGFGYLPGHMPWKCQEALEKEGMTIMNTTETGDVTVDRELITGDSPYAAKKLGEVAAPILVKHATG